MILTCPSCGTRYKADRSRFSPPGCNVRCAKCSHVWFHVVADQEPDAEPEPAAVVPPRDESLAAVGGLDRPFRTETPAAPPKQRSPKPGIGLPALAGWLALIAFVGAFVWSAIVYRQPVAEAWPSSSSFYALVGLPVNVRGLALEDVAFNREFEDGQPVLAITGTVRNITGRELPVPEIRVSLNDIERRELYSWNFAAGVATLAPGESNPFMTRLSNPPPEARSVDVRFRDVGAPP